MVKLKRETTGHWIKDNTSGRINKKFEFMDNSIIINGGVSQRRKSVVVTCHCTESNWGG